MTVKLTNLTLLIKIHNQYAEVGYSRLGAIPTRILDEDLVAFSVLTAQLCSQCQLFEKWFIYVIRVLSGSDSGSGHVEEVCDLSDFQAIYQEIREISLIIKSCVVEIMLQDIESLLQLYLGKMSRRFNRLHKEEEREDEHRNSIAISMQDL